MPTTIKRPKRITFKPKHKPPGDQTKTLKEILGGGTEACENCRPIRKANKKKKPMYKLGSWRGLFKDTPDF